MESQNFAVKYESLAICSVDGHMQKSQMHLNASSSGWFLFPLNLPLNVHRINHVLCLRDLQPKPKGKGNLIPALPAISFGKSGVGSLLTLSFWSEVDFAKHQIKTKPFLPSHSQFQSFYPVMRPPIYFWTKAVCLVEHPCLCFLWYGVVYIRFWSRKRDNETNWLTITLNKDPDPVCCCLTF